ncbi:D-inositol-3-phosphate glycosyltransferase [compost metagenome]
MKKLAIVTTHPIQYYAPVFELLAQHCELKVYYTWGQTAMGEKYDPDFRKTITWDIPLLKGYNHTFVNNHAKNPGSHHFFGIDNPKLIEEIELFDPAVILLYGWAYKSHLQVIRYFHKKIPVWLRGDSNLLDVKAGLKRRLRALALRWVFSYLDKALYVGTANKAYFKEYGLKENQLIFMPHAIDNKRFDHVNSKESQVLRVELGLNDHDLLLTFAGKLENKKSPLLLLEAFMALNLPNTHLLFVGNGHLENLLKEKADFSPFVHFLDFQNQRNMPVIYHMSDLFCLPSKGPGETWGLAVNEAMAAQKAILVSNKVGCAADLIRNGVNGYVFEAENKHDLMEKLSLLLEDHESLKEMGKESARIIKDWSFEKQTQAILDELYK